MRRRQSGAGLLLHGLAHALPATAAISTGTSWLFGRFGIPALSIRWLAGLSSTIAVGALIAAGFGFWNVPAFRRQRRVLAAAGATASLFLLVAFQPNLLMLPGVLIDIAILDLVRRHGLRDPVAEPELQHGPVRRAVRYVGNACALVITAWLAIATLTNPWTRFWGSRPDELALVLPGDQPTTGPATYWIQHAVTIDAPARDVWPWLAQIGTDKGGFYSISWLERLFGVPVHNAASVHDEWQKVETGGFVLATPSGYLGIDRPLGWDIDLVVPNRALVLRDWGAFVLQPVEPNRTRLIVRTRGAQPASLSTLAFSWIELAAFEPAHFIMERAMLLGIRRRAEAEIDGSG